VFASPSLGGTSWWDYVANAPAEYDMMGQVIIQAQGVLVTIVISGVVAFIAFKLVDLLIGLRVDEEQEMMGLDTTTHGERAYNE
jgi:ammonium transporter, Amt family